MQSTNTFELARYGADLQRRMHDMPIGDPLSGAPYGEYLKSKALGMVIGVVASVVTMGAAAPLMASTVLATQIAGGVMMAGGVLSGVGTLTGNKKLAKIGGIMSLAGGLGGLASNALNAGGVGGAFASGSGSEAVSSMANSFMDSASSISGGLLYGDRVAGAAEAKAAMDFSSTPDTLAKSQGQLYGPAEDVISGAAKVEPSAGAIGTGGAEQPKGGILETGTIDGKNPVPQPDGKATITLDQTPAAQSSGNFPFAEDAPGAGINQKTTIIEPAVKTTDKGIFAKASGFISDNKELLKTGAGALEMGMKYGMGGDAAEAATQEALAKAKVYDAQATLLGTQNEQAQFNLANQNKKSVMLSADDPQLEQKLAQAKADGAAVGIIPIIGGGGIKQTGPTAFNTAANSVAPTGQQVVRQPTFNAPTPQRAA